MIEGKSKKIKKSFALNARSYEVVREFTAAHGLSLSSWITTMFDEAARQIEGGPVHFAKPVSKMTIQELAEMMNYWKKSVEESEGENP